MRTTLRRPHQLGVDRKILPKIIEDDLPNENTDIVIEISNQSVGPVDFKHGSIAKSLSRVRTPSKKIQEKIINAEEKASKSSLHTKYAICLTSAQYSYRKCFAATIQSKSAMIVSRRK